MVPTQGGFRSVTLNGRNTGQNYQVALSRDLPDYSALGNAHTSAACGRTILTTNAHTAQLDFDAALKKFDAQAMARLIENILRVVDADNLKQLHVAQSAICPEISGALRPVVDQAAADLPQSQPFCKYIELKSIGTPDRRAAKTIRNHDARQIQNERSRTRLPAAQEIHKESIRATCSVLQIYTSDTKGRNLSSFVINAQTEEFYLAFNTAAARFCR